MINKRKWVLVSFILLSVWITGFLILPYLHASSATANLIAGVYGRVCHQIPERSFYLNGSPIGVCARCTAFYISGWILFVIYLIRKEVNLFPDIIYLILSVPMMLDIIMEKFGIYHNIVFLRVLSGLLFGLAIFHIVLIGMQPVISYKIWLKKVDGKSKDHQRCNNRGINRRDHQYDTGTESC
jgi:uncharacterized membrane protein